MVPEGHSQRVSGVVLEVMCEVHLWGASVSSLFGNSEVRFGEASMVRVVVCEVSSRELWVPRPLEFLVVGILGG